MFSEISTLKEPLFIVTSLGYVAGLVLYFLNFEFQKDHHLRWAHGFVALSLTTHSLFLLIKFLSAGSLAITNLSDTFQVVTFLMLLISFLMESRYQIRYLMLFSLPAGLLFCLLAILLSGSSVSVATNIEKSKWLWIHTGLVMSGFASLILAASSAVMYLLQSSQLKSKHLGKIFLKLPSLTLLDKFHFATLFWGAVLFSLGILSGLFWAGEIKELREILKDPLVFLSFLTCLVYWIVLSFRLSALRRGQKIAVGTVFIFLLLFVTLLCSTYCPSGFHQGF